MGIKAAIQALLGNKQPRNAYNEREIKFYKEARSAKEHGRVVVSHLSLGLDQVEVPFVFPGMSEPPKLDDRLMTDIRSAAESQGYIFHHLIPHRYGRLIVSEDHAAWNEIVLDLVGELNEDGQANEVTIHHLLSLLGNTAHDQKIAITGVDNTKAPTGQHADSLTRMADHLTSVELPLPAAKVSAYEARHSMIGRMEELAVDNADTVGELGAVGGQLKFRSSGVQH